MMMEQLREAQNQKIQRLPERVTELTAERNLEVNNGIPILEFPSFDGVNPRNWITKCSRYFALYKIPESQRVEVASLHLVGRAATWFANYIAVRKYVDWCDFILDVCTCFKEERGSRLIENFHKLHQTGSNTLCLGNHIPIDAPQVLDKSPKSNPDISSHGWVGEGQGESSVGSHNAFGEQLDGLNPSNGLFEKSISSIHERDSDLCEQEEISEDGNSEMCVDEELLVPVENLKAIAVDLNAVCGDLRARFREDKGIQFEDAAKIDALKVFDKSTKKDPKSVFMEAGCGLHGGWQWAKLAFIEAVNVAFDPGGNIRYNNDDLGVTEQEEVPVSPEMQVGHSQLIESHNGQGMNLALDGFFRGGNKCWYHGWKEANGFYPFVFDPGKLGVKLGVGQGIPPAKSLVCTYAWQVEQGNAQQSFDRAHGCCLLVFDPGGLLFLPTMSSHCISRCPSELESVLDVDELGLRVVETVAALAQRSGKKGNRSCRRCCLMRRSWRRRFHIRPYGLHKHFALEENMVEVDCPCVAPEIVLKASGHVDKLCKPFHLEEPISCPLKIKYQVSEADIAFRPACWLWDYLRRSGTSGFLLSLSGGADSSSVAVVVGCICQLVVKEIEMGDEQMKADAIRIGQYAAGQFATDSKSLVFFVSWDVMVCEGKESCSEYIKGFLAAFLVGDMQADMMKGVMASTPLRHHYTAEYVAYKHTVARFIFDPMGQFVATLLAFFMDVFQLARMVSVGALLAFTVVAVSSLQDFIDAFLLRYSDCKLLLKQVAEGNCTISAMRFSSLMSYTLCATGGLLLLSSLTALTCIDQDDAKHSFGCIGGFICPTVPHLPIYNLLHPSVNLLHEGGCFLYGGRKPDTGEKAGRHVQITCQLAIAVEVCYLAELLFRQVVTAVGCASHCS